MRTPEGKLVYDHVWHTPHQGRRAFVRLRFIGKHANDDMARATAEAKRRGVRVRRVIREWGVHKDSRKATHVMAE